MYQKWAKDNAFAFKLPSNVKKEKATQAQQTINTHLTE
jgi:hypothetical protein